MSDYRWHLNGHDATSKIRLPLPLRKEDVVVGGYHLNIRALGLFHSLYASVPEFGAGPTSCCTGRGRFEEEGDSLRLEVKKGTWAIVCVRSVNNEIAAPSRTPTSGEQTGYFLFFSFPIRMHANLCRCSPGGAAYNKFLFSRFALAFRKVRMREVLLVEAFTE